MLRDLEISDFEIESLVPDELSDVDADKFLDLFKQYDDEMKLKFEEAKNNSKVLRYTAKLSKNNEVFIGLSQYPEDSGCTLYSPSSSSGSSDMSSASEDGDASTYGMGMGDNDSMEMLSDDSEGIASIFNAGFESFNRLSSKQTNNRW